MARRKEYSLSIRCFFINSERYTQHYTVMPLRDLEKWVEAYQYTHPTLESVMVRIRPAGWRGADADGE